MTEPHPNPGATAWGAAKAGIPRSIKRALRHGLAGLTRVASNEVTDAALRRCLELKVLREWRLADEPPHFSDHRTSFALFALRQDPVSWEVFARAFYSAEVVRQGDVVLDIGCGDGFLTRRFLGPRASRVDGIDIEPSAIDVARREESERVRFHLLDAASAPFPALRYDVIVWDGAIGHFSSEGSAALLAKIRDALAPDGVFCGSESLGHEGTDHLQFFEGLEDLRRLLLPHFPYVRAREHEFPCPGFVRREAYWRCARTPEGERRLDGWR